MFYIQTDSDDYYSIERMIIGIEDVGAFDSGAYGNGITLTTGIVVRVSNSDAVKRYLTPFPVRNNGEWAMCCHDFTAHDFGQGNTIASVRWNTRTNAASCASVLFKKAALKWLKG